MPLFRLHRPRAVAFLAASVVLIIGGSGAAGAAECWLPPVEAPIADPYRPPSCRWCPGNRGIEYDTPPGAPVRAVRAGTVVFAGSVAGTGYVVVEHPNGWRTTYGGVSDRRVGRGDVVLGRTVLAETGGPLHFGLRDGPRYIDPTPHLGRAVFLTRLVPLDDTVAAPAGPPRVVCRR